MLKVLFIGDVCGRAGRQALRKGLHPFVEREGVDFVVANGENAAGGLGITPETADELLDVGVHVLTSGNHIWRKREIYPYLEDTSLLLRPENYPPGAPGKGWNVYRAGTGTEIAVINLQGRVFMPPVDCPFRAVERILEELEGGPAVRLVDFHAEATSEKIAMGWFLDGRVSALVGTHTHVQTADEQILPGGTGYITDAGMTGAFNSVLGMHKENALRRFLTGMPERLQPARKNPAVQGVLLDLDPSSGTCRDIRRVHLRDLG